MFNNPLILRYRYSVMRPRQFWVYITMYILAITLLLLINNLVKENLFADQFNTTAPHHLYIRWRTRL
jgi:hypothetical protein